MNIEQEIVTTCTRTPTNVRVARRMRAIGLPYSTIARRFGVSRNTIRKWIHPEILQADRLGKVTYRLRNAPERRAKALAAYHALSGDELRRINEKKKLNVMESTDRKRRFAYLVARVGEQAIPELRRALDQAMLYWCRQGTEIHPTLMERCCGLSSEDLNRKIGGVRPQFNKAPELFDLLNPHHILRIVHHSNIVRKRGEVASEGQDFVDGADALAAAHHFIISKLNAVNRRLKRERKIKPYTAPLDRVQPDDQCPASLLG